MIRFQDIFQFQLIFFAKFKKKHYFALLENLTEQFEFEVRIAPGSGVCETTVPEPTKANLIPVEDNISKNTHKSHPIQGGFLAK